jgi:uncharacterized protein (DUF779 family)
MSDHTPGEWTLTFGERSPALPLVARIAAIDGSPIALVNVLRPNGEANAALIASAPALLKELGELKEDHQLMMFHAKEGWNLANARMAQWKEEERLNGELKAQRDELLEALRAIQRWASDGSVPWCFPKGTLEAAIKKAEGKA